MAPSMVNLRVFIWIPTEDFRRNMTEVRGRVITKTKIILESNGFNLPAEITELKYYDASSPIKIENRESAKESKEQPEKEQANN